MSFSELQLSPPLLETLEEIGYTTPTPIQEKSIPAILSNRDVMAAAQTGTGKTAGFTLPLLEKLSKGPRPGSNQARALILTPTRELADQVGESVKVYSQKLNLRSTVVYGGVKINPQMLRLRKGVDVLVATPGRLLDLHQHNAVKFSNLEVLILDEADRMLDMGFIHDIKKIIKSLPKERQNLLFSATFSPQIQELAKTFIHDPIEISVSPRNSTAKTVKQWAVPVDKKEKPALLVKLIKDQQWPQVLVFCKTKHGSNRLVTYLEKHDISAVAIHGNKSQGARTRALEQFKNGRVTALVATDIAARGLDISQLPHVVNFDLPKVAEDYVHRIGRTGRAGSTGEAVSLLSADEFNELTGIERLIQKVIERVEIDGFEPNHCVPASPTTLKPVKKKRPKKKKKPNPQSQTKEQNRNSSNRTKRSAKPKSRPKNKTATSRRPAKPTNKRRPSK